MESPEPEKDSSAAYINTLNECDAKIVSLLRIHADAVKCLTAEGGNSKLSAEQRRLIFQHKVAEFTRVLADVRDTQHRAIHALRDTAAAEPGRLMLDADDDTDGDDADADADANATSSRDEEKVMGEKSKKKEKRHRAVLGELGDLDVSYLNAQNDDIGKQIEAEQWAKAAELVKKFEEVKKAQEQQEQESSS